MINGENLHVHVSNRTVAYLNGHFEVEPALGERSEDALRAAGLKTYFITRVLKPFSEAKSGANPKKSPNINGTEDTEEDLLGPLQDEDEECANANANTERKTPTDLEKQKDFKKRLQYELVARDGHGNLAKDSSIFLKFKRQDLESLYCGYREPYSSVPLFAALLVQCVDIVLSFIILPRSPLHLINITAPLIPISMLVFISVSESFPRQIPAYFVNISKRFNDVIYLRELAAIIIAITIGFSNLIDMYFFANVIKVDNNMTNGRAENFTAGNFSHSLADYIVADASSLTKSDILLYPSYMSNFAVLILIAVAVIAQLTHITKILLMIIITVLHCYCNIYIMNDLFLLEDYLTLYPNITTSYSVSGILIVGSFALSLLARHMDREDRVIFKWKTEVSEQKEMASDMRQRNEALVYNVLPVHVAEHFMKNTKCSYDDLYSQSYSEVGVLFASMPNFADFYTEESVNNQGLECLRFLNEVISDFDALLELPQFQDIIKIKTIGSTYMAASGINLARSSTQDTVQKRWAHLDSLVEFALELKKALQGINEQSFNHFLLKMGINHGPITAGVIGARKPHYDIWGNTVNVASRMESTGRAGAIQVTEETCKILEEFGYKFEQRGLVTVKGKGQLMTYYLQGKTCPMKTVMDSNRFQESQEQTSKAGTQAKATLSPTGSVESTKSNPSKNVSEFGPDQIDSNLLRSPPSHKTNTQVKSNGLFEDNEADIKTPLLQMNIKKPTQSSSKEEAEEDDRESLIE